MIQQGFSDPDCREQKRHYHGEKSRNLANKTAQKCSNLPPGERADVVGMRNAAVYGPTDAYLRTKPGSDEAVKQAESLRKAHRGELR